MTNALLDIFIGLGILAVVILIGPRVIGLALRRVGALALAFVWFGYILTALLLDVTSRAMMELGRRPGINRFWSRVFDIAEGKK